MNNKLIVVGSSDPNPENWKPWDGVELYLADSAKDAVFMAGYHHDYPAAEVDMTKSRLVLKDAPYIEE